MKEKKLLGITSCEKLSNDKIVFWVKNTNRVFLYDLKKKESIRYIEIDDCDVRTTTFFGSTLLDETLVLAPYRDRKMPFCNLATGKTKWFDIGDSDDRDQWNAYKCIIDYKDKLFLLGDSYVIKVYDKNKESISCIDVPNRMYIYRDVCRVNDTVIVPLIDTGGKRRSVLELDLKDENYNVYNDICTNMDIATICYCDGHYWMSGNEKMIVRWNKENNSITEVDVTGYCDGIIDEFDSYYSSSVTYGKTILFSPINAKAILKLDTDTLSMENMFCFDKDEGVWKFYRVNDCYLYFQVENIKKNESLEDFLIDFDGNVIQKELVVGIVDNSLIYETRIMSIREFVNQVVG